MMLRATSNRIGIESNVFDRHAPDPEESAAHAMKSTDSTEHDAARAHSSVSMSADAAERKRKQLERELLKKKKEERRIRAAAKKKKKLEEVHGETHVGADNFKHSQNEKDEVQPEMKEEHDKNRQEEPTVDVRALEHEDVEDDGKETNEEKAMRSFEEEKVLDTHITQDESKEQEVHESEWKHEHCEPLASHPTMDDDTPQHPDVHEEAAVALPSSRSSTLVLVDDEKPQPTLEEPVVDKKSSRKKIKKPKDHETNEIDDTNADVAAATIQKAMKKKLKSFLKHPSKVLVEEAIASEAPASTSQGRQIDHEQEKMKTARQYEGPVATRKKTMTKSSKHKTRKQKREVAPAPYDEPEPVVRVDDSVEGELTPLPPRYASYHRKSRAQQDNDTYEKPVKDKRGRKSSREKHGNGRRKRKNKGKSSSSASSSSSSKSSSRKSASSSARSSSNEDAAHSSSSRDRQRYRRRDKPSRRRSRSSSSSSSSSLSSSSSSCPASSRSIRSSNHSTGPPLALLPPMTLAACAAASAAAAEATKPDSPVEKPLPVLTLPESFDLAIFTPYCRQVVRIQAWLRGVQGRRIAAQRRMEFELEMHEEAMEEVREEACVRIQAVVKGYLIRKQMSFMFSSSVPARKARPKVEAAMDEGDGGTAADAELAVNNDESDEAKAIKNVAEWPQEFNLELFDEWQELNSISTVDGEQSVTHTHFLSKNKLRVFCGTWNLHAKKPHDDLRRWIPLNKYHIVAVGTEECVNTIAKSVVFTSKKQWEDQLKETLGDEYVLVASHALTAIHNVVFVHESVFPLVHHVHSDAVATGLGNQLGNKGGVGIAFCVGQTSFAFVNCHFDAHQHNIEKRNGNYHRINQELRLTPQPVALATTNGLNGKKLAVSECFDRVFWFGDLNYRINGTRKMIDRLLLHNFHAVLVFNDQLRIAMEKHQVFAHFREGPLHFRPTYKFDKHRDVYDSSAKQRIPSWTDRILYLSNEKPHDIEILSYRSEMSFRTSDHRPVAAVFQVNFRPHANVQRVEDYGTDFSRVLAKGFRGTQTKSEVCSVQ